jgi:hypothetical protein
MTIFKRVKTPSDNAKSKAKDIQDMATEVMEKGRDKASTVAQSALSDDARKELNDAFDQILKKVRESGALAKMQDEAHAQLTDALETAREKVKDNAPAAKSKLADARGMMGSLPGRKKRRSKLRMVMMGFVIVPAVVSTLFTLKKKFGSSRDKMDDYDAGGELAWGESTYNPASTSSTANMEMPTPYEPAVASTMPSGNGSSAGSSSTANGVSSSRESDKGATKPDANTELLNE